MDRDHIQAKAFSAGFVRRKSKLTAGTFLQMLLYCSSREDCSSLSTMCGILEESFGVNICEQSLHERFGQSCRNIVLSVLQELIEDQIQALNLYRGDFWDQFSRVRIKDSTKFKITDNMKQEYKGNGGSAAGICIQYEYDLVTGKIFYLDVGSGGGNDD